MAASVCWRDAAAERPASLRRNSWVRSPKHPYTNNSSGPLSSVVIYDHTPAITTFSSANHGALPAQLTNVVATTPAVAGAGAIQWTFTGTLAPAGSGTVTFSVTLEQ